MSYTTIRIALCVVGILLPMMAGSQATTRTVSKAQKDSVIAQKKAFTAGRDHITWQLAHPRWRPLIAQCIRGEMQALRQQVAAEEAKYESFTSRSKLDSAKANNANLTDYAPLIARYRCMAKRGVLVTYFGEKIDQVPFGGSPSDPAIAFAWERKVVDDWLPARWAQIRLYMLVNGPDQWLRAGPWALSETTLQALSQGKGSDSELEKALTEQGARMAINAMTIDPWARQFNNLYYTFANNLEFPFQNAGMGRARTSKGNLDDPAFGTPMEIEQAFQEATDRLVAAFFCTYAETDLTKNMTVPIPVYVLKVCPTPDS